jgi:hypothetical protein
MIFNNKLNKLLIWCGNYKWIAKLETMIKISKLETISLILKLKIKNKQWYIGIETQ